MSFDQEKKFVIKEVFENALNMNPGEEKYGEIQEHLGVLWKIKLVRTEPEGVSLFFYLDCLKPNYCENEWTINTNIGTKIGESEHCTFSEKHSFTQEEMSTAGDSYTRWSNISKYLTNGKLSVEFSVTINSVIGVDLQTKKLKNFDDDVAKEFSDVVLMAGNQEFYVNKMYLTSHSTYFKSLLLGNFSESQKSIIELKDIDPKDLQKFLELLYGESTIKDYTVAGILKLADMYDAKTAIRRCEEFLRMHSNLSVKDKFEIAVKYKLNELTMECILEMKTVQELETVVPEDVYQLDHDVLVELFKKLLTLAK